MRAASSALRPAHVFGNPYAATRHVLHFTVTARCECSERADSSAAEANMKNPSKSGSASTGEAPPPPPSFFSFLFFFFFFFLARPKSLFSLAGVLSEPQHPGQRTEENSEYRLLPVS